MERLFKIRIFTVMFFLAVASIAANAKESKKEGDNYHAKQILIVGLHDNVKSNYFYNGMIAEETGMKADSIDQTYNTIIAENIKHTATTTMEMSENPDSMDTIPVIMNMQTKSTAIAITTILFERLDVVSPIMISIVLIV